ncbi:hypothetical protein BJY00DRAFT_297083 [Aspergillus carlsbadensis]|nr:hypothetical protein BJY00DRAFT_297083 [Aspergillus carlsbadensis]
MHVSNEPKPRPGHKRYYTDGPFAKKDWILRPHKRSRRDPRYLYQPTFWDRLSKVQLTKRALVELNRQTSNPNSSTQPHNPASTPQLLSG